MGAGRSRRERGARSRRASGRVGRLQRHRRRLRISGALPRRGERRAQTSAARPPSSPRATSRTLPIPAPHRRASLPQARPRATSASPRPSSRRARTTSSSRSPSWRSSIGREKRRAARRRDLARLHRSARPLVAPESGRRHLPGRRRRQAKTSRNCAPSAKPSWHASTRRTPRAAAAAAALADVAKRACRACRRRASFTAGTVHTGSGTFARHRREGGKPRPIFLLARGQVTQPRREVGPGALQRNRGAAGAF